MQKPPFLAPSFLLTQVWVSWFLARQLVHPGLFPWPSSMPTLFRIFLVPSGSEPPTPENKMFLMPSKWSANTGRAHWKCHGLRGRISDFSMEEYKRVCHSLPKLAGDGDWTPQHWTVWKSGNMIKGVGYYGKDQALQIHTRRTQFTRKQTTLRQSAEVELSAQQCVTLQWWLMTRIKMCETHLTAYRNKLWTRVRLEASHVFEVGAWVVPALKFCERDWPKIQAGLNPMQPLWV